MLKIRFLRKGRKHQPFFKIVVTKKTNPPKGGKFIEELGFYNPISKEKKVQKEKITYWIAKGAKPSDSLYNFLIKEKVIKGSKIPVHKKTKKKKKEEKQESAKTSS